LLDQYAAALQGEGASEDALAYFRDASQYRNYTLLELPHSTALAPTARGERDYAVTIVRNFLYSALMVLVWEQLQTSGDAQLAAIGAKSLKEARYHLRHARDWLVRFGDGTAESHARAQSALDFLLPYTMEFWTATEVESAAFAANIALDLVAARAQWEALIEDAVLEATLALSPTHGFVPAGKLSVHSEHLGFLLAEMQSLARQHPGAQW
jgi:ring-1,2-phenylacetyl-CoA epoxidase subunit PaaC